ncbi:hypothetical protein ILUMI_05299 [Ignelater luminosus]|uniref:Torsin n=1 Tax=Ignelater luminosus TaxID=2038154 RepID=A0A8K0D802_IGNLU|nr:hypothetical protein ILUMI_05299 [Ignelater luminosus]
MRLHIWKIVFVIVCNVIHFAISVELLSIGAAAVVGVGSFIYQNTLCRLKECCTKNEIPADFDKLEQLLDEKVYGQHLAKETIVNALRGHWSDNYESPKALTLSFHGWPGGGKNYIAGFIKDSLYALGSKSDHVHHFMGRIHFPEVARTQEYQDNLYQWIKGNVTRCQKQLFIFDEVNKMPPKVLNVIKPMIDYNQDVEKVDYRKAIFIFLSNTGESLITEKAIQLWKSGVRREDVGLKDFESVITMGAFNEEGGFHHSDTIKSNLIDHYIPFLPMEHEHVRLCIIDQFKLRSVLEPKEEHIQEVMDFVEWGPLPDNLYSKTGCKRLSQKVAMTVQKYRIREKAIEKSSEKTNS